MMPWKAIRDMGRWMDYEGIDGTYRVCGILINLYNVN
jgi:hypothetical protein